MIYTTISNFAAFIVHTFQGSILEQYSMLLKNTAVKYYY